MIRLLSIWLSVMLLVGCTDDSKITGGPPPGGHPAQGKLALTKVVDGLERPLYIGHAGDGSGRLFVLEQPGRVRVMRGGQLLTEPFLDLTAKVLSTGNEQGLLGLAFAPDYRESGIFYVHYTGLKGQTVIARYRVSDQNPDQADAGSEQVILTYPQPYANHNGGAILFGPDGYLYIALGDGGSAGDPQNNAQNLESLLGKILRIDVTGSERYRIPPDNPFVGRPGRDEIWAYGLRNPWRISFDRATGDLYIADVGQSKIEEVNFQRARSQGGQNYGWRFYEGRAPYRGETTEPVVFPVIEYSHEGGNCSVTGGNVYRGKAVPALVGTYLFGDFCSGVVWGARQVGDTWQATVLLRPELNISAFGEDEQGEIYVVDLQGGIYTLGPS